MCALHGEACKNGASLGIRRSTFVAACVHGDLGDQYVHASYVFVVVVHFRITVYMGGY